MVKLVDTKDLIKNLRLILISFVVGLLIVEITARILTDFPKISNDSNMVADSNFGSKVSSSLEDVDELGFRNVNGKSDKFQIAAIGDSHTYGYNVKSKDAWPYQLEEIIDVPIYNYGIGGLGIYSYHFLIKDALAKNKKVILGLYLPNDLMYSGYVCSIDFNNFFWEKEVARLKLNPPAECGSFNSVNTTVDFLNVGLKNSALLSMIYELIYIPIRRKQTADKNKVDFYERFSPIKIDRLEAHKKLTDLENPKISSVFSDFKKMVNDWEQISKDGALGIILIPSRQLIYQSTLEQLDIAPESVARLQFYTENEILLGEQLLNLFRNLKIPALSAKSNILEEFINDLPSKGVEQFYPDSGHPNVAGYKAYAKTAKEVYLEMKAMSE